MIVYHYMSLVKGSDQNKWKMNQNEEERPKNKEKIAKCEDCRLSKNLSEKGEKRVQLSK